MADITYTPGAGEHTYGQPLKIPYWGQVTIGKYCSIADNVEFCMIGDHNIDWVTAYPFHNIEYWNVDRPLEPYRRKNEIVVGNDVWLGYGCKIMHGIRIGDGAVIGGYAVVAKDVRPYAVIVGNPATEIKRRFPDDVVDFLLELKWWDWPEEKIKANMEILLSPNVEDLMKLAEEEGLPGGK